MDYTMKSTDCALFLVFGSFCLSLSVMCDTKIITAKVAKFSEWSRPRQLASSELKNKTLPTIRLQDITNRTNEAKPVTEDTATIVFPGEDTTIRSVSNVTTVRDVVTVRTESNETTTSGITLDLNDYDENSVGNRFGIDVSVNCPKGYRHTKSKICEPVMEDSSDR